MQRLSLIDASYLQRETPATPMHTGGVAVFAPGLRFSDVRAALAERLDEMPLARRRVQRLGQSRSLPSGRAIWVDDPDFDLSYHVRHAALPAPGDRAQLYEFVARLISRPLDRQRPLWELYVIEGLEGDRVALFRKLHVAITAGPLSDPLSLLLQEHPQRLRRLRASGDRWQPEPPPSGWELRLETTRGRAEQLAALTCRAVETMSRPTRLLRAATRAAGAAGDVALRALRAAPASPLNRPLSPHRRFATTEITLSDVRAIRRAVGGSIHEIVVAVTADAVGRLLRWRGHDTKDLDLRVMVPVRVHDKGPDSAMTVGEGVVGVLAVLPVLEMDPVARLYRVRGEMAGLKESRQAVAADALVRLAGYAPPQLHALAARIVAGDQRYNVALSNAPGPQSPRYLHRSLLEDSYAFVPLAGDCGLAVAVTSYAGRMFVGLLGERDTMPDIDMLACFMHEAVDDLLDTARRAG